MTTSFPCPRTSGVANNAQARPREYLQFAGGLAMPVEPVLLVLDLEARGFQMTRDADDRILVRPGHALTEDDKAALARWKHHVLALIDLCEAVQ